MSNSTSPSTGNRNQMLSILGILGCMLLFLFILMVTYLPNRDADPLAATVEERKRLLNEVRSRATNELRSTEIRDAGEGLYKIPVDQAIELTVQDYQKKQNAS